MEVPGGRNQSEEIYLVRVTLAGYWRFAAAEAPWSILSALGRSQQLLRSCRLIRLLTFPFKSDLRSFSKHSMRAQTRTRAQAVRLWTVQTLYFDSCWAPVSLLVSFSRRTGVAHESTAMPHTRAWGLLLCTVLPVSHHRLPAHGL